MKPTTPRRFRARKIANNTWSLYHPDGYWIGPGSGCFPSLAAALDWLARELRTF